MEQEYVYLIISLHKKHNRRKDIMTISELIARENIEREANNPRVIFINYQYQGPGCKMFNLYFANLLPINPQEFLQDFKRYGNDFVDEDDIRDYRKLKLDSEFDENVFNYFVNSTTFMSMFPGNSDGNRLKRYRVIGKDDIVFNYECSEFNKETFDSVIDAYLHIPGIETSIPIEGNAVYTLKSPEEKDIFGAARLDGCSPLEAYAIVLGLEVSTNKIPCIGGYYELKKDYREYFENVFGER